MNPPISKINMVGILPEAYPGVIPVISPGVLRENSPGSTTQITSKIPPKICPAGYALETFSEITSEITFWIFFPEIILVIEISP